MTKTGLEFGNLGPARRVGSSSEARTILVIVICLIFAICDLEFLVTPADCRKGGKIIEAQSGGSNRLSSRELQGVASLVSCFWHYICVKIMPSPHVSCGLVQENLRGRDL